MNEYKGLVTGRIRKQFSAYDSTCQIAQQIAEKIQQRNQYERNGENTTKLTVTIRALLQNLKEKIALLKDLLLRAVSTHQITQLEGDRRQNLLDDLVTRERLLLASFKNEGAEPDLIRSSLMTGGAKRGAPNPWLLEEPEETRGLGFDEIRQQQQRIIQEQDAGLDALSSIISRQKQMGQEIGNELDEQNEIIDDLANLVENTDEKLRTETRRVNMVDRKSMSCVQLSLEAPLKPVQHQSSTNTQPSTDRRAVAVLEVHWPEMKPKSPTGRREFLHWTSISPSALSETG
ncbi:LOW QUALITY PROTEIN: syntaxin-8 [Orycteropus afer afer]|uniref:LOW QUALITY PROTEIN: syntaxin-8 n=1 Tax=Orycteropus afer afer TaxID=1230840 RepID=A0AC54Z6J7_ORYAF|nr:LOW QUALITY PROTEIN: syntaxin-8 [Orycteropus afer afer]